MHLTTGIYSQLNQAFLEGGLSITIKLDHIVVESSEDQLEERVSKIIESIGFCPLVSQNKIKNKVFFTISPYRIPDFFQKNQSNAVISSEKSLSEASLIEYLSLEEAFRLLEASTFVSREEVSENLKDRWSQVNQFRAFVSPALNRGLLDIILPHLKQESPAVEIGSGIGYSLPEGISKKMIRIQPAIAECRLLSTTTKDPIYQLDIEGMYNNLIGAEKKIPLFFALNVFDVLPPEKRRSSLLQLSQLQNRGDRILMMLDTNPCLEVIVGELEALHPDCAIFPYFSLTKKPSKMSVLIVPMQYVQHKPSESDMIAMIEDEARAIMDGRTSHTQHALRQLQGTLNLKVIELESFFTEQLSNELKQTGYKSRVYYHSSFTTGDLPKGLSGIKQDLIYKSVTDTATVRQWSLQDKNLLVSLSNKGIRLPEQFNDQSLQNLREKGQKIFGAEILVVEATKM